MTKNEIRVLVKTLSNNGITLYWHDTGGKSHCLTDDQACSLVESFLPKTNLDNLTLKQYFQTDYWQDFAQEILKQNKCEGCGNKGTKVFLKTFYVPRGSETINDVMVLCNKCKAVNGQVIDYRTINPTLDDEIKSNPNFENWINDRAQELIRKRAEKLLKGYRVSHRFTQQEIKEVFNE